MATYWVCRSHTTTFSLVSTDQILSSTLEHSVLGINAGTGAYESTWSKYKNIHSSDPVIYDGNILNIHMSSELQVLLTSTSPIIVCTTEVSCGPYLIGQMFRPLTFQKQVGKSRKVCHWRILKTVLAMLGINETKVLLTHWQPGWSTIIHLFSLDLQMHVRLYLKPHYFPD